MSYILNALDKTKDKKHALPDSEQQVVHAQMPIIASPNSSIAWGILLTLAIFLSLLIGFYLGQNSAMPSVNQPEHHSVAEKEQEGAQQKNAVTSVKPVKAVVPVKQKVETTETPEVQTNGIELAQVKSAPLELNLTAPEISKPAESEVLMAESYFDSPPEQKTRHSLLNNPDKTVVYKSSEPKPAPPVVVDPALKAENNQARAIEQIVEEETPEVSADLLARFKLAVEDTAYEEDDNSAPQEDASDFNQGIKPLSKMPQWVKDEIPSLSFDMHIYSSDGDGWVKVNGQERRENQFISKDLVLRKIEPQQVIMMYKGQVFSLPALTNW